MYVLEKIKWAELAFQLKIVDYEDIEICCRNIKLTILQQSHEFVSVCCWTQAHKNFKFFI